MSKRRGKEQLVAAACNWDEERIERVRDLAQVITTVTGQPYDAWAVVHACLEEGLRHNEKAWSALVALKKARQ